MMFFARSFWRCLFTGRGSGGGAIVGDSTINRGGVDGEDSNGQGCLDGSGDEERDTIDGTGLWCTRGDSVGIVEGCIVVVVGGSLGLVAVGGTLGSAVVGGTLGSVAR